MPKFTVYVPVDLQHALAELDRRGIDKSKLFCDAMLGFLLECDDYDPESNSLEDLALRLKRLEQWVACHETEHEVDDVENEPLEIVGTIHITIDGTHALCGSKHLDKTFPVEEHDRLVDHPKTNPCIACRKLYQKAVERSEERDDG